jgi:hypothetical protein
MARARTIKPGFFANDTLAEVHPLGRLLFAGLWTIADRAGRLEDRPRRIKAAVLPYDECDVDALLGVLAERGFILRYARGTARYIQILRFEAHQNPHKNEGASTIPAPGDSAATPGDAPEQHGTRTVQAPEQHGTNPADHFNQITDHLIGTPSESGAAAADAAIDAPAKTAVADGDVYALVDAWANATDRRPAQLQGRPRLEAFNALKPVAGDVTADDVRACVAWFRSDPFWAAPGKLTVLKLADTLPQWIAQGRPARVASKSAAVPSTPPPPVSRAPALTTEADRKAFADRFITQLQES